MAFMGYLYMLRAGRFSSESANYTLEGSIYRTLLRYGGYETAFTTFEILLLTVSWRVEKLAEVRGFKT